MRHTFGFGLVGSTLLVACGADGPPPPRAPTEVAQEKPAVARETPAPAPACTGGPQCLKQGLAALASGGGEARALLGRACDAGELDGCLELGKAYATAKGGPADVGKAREAFGKTCGGPISLNDGCAWLVRSSRAAGAGVDASVVAKAAKTGCSVLGSDDANREVRAEACVALGESLRKNGQDDRAATRAFADACELGNAASCDAVKQAETAKAAAEKTAEKTPRGPDDVEGANVNVAGMTVDGLTISDLACKTEGGGLGGLFGSIALGASFKGRKGRLDDCSRGAIVETRVKWTGAGGRMTNIRATSKDAKINKCVENALSGAASTTSGTCAATIKHGRK